MTVAARKKGIEDLRSQRWFGGSGPSSAHKRRRMLQGGFTLEDFQGKPVIAILSTWSDFATCHTHFPQMIEEVKRGIWQAGGFPAVIPVQSLSESFLRPSSMLYRNLLALDVEESIRAHPVDGAVLLGGCDKTGPGLVMGAASANVPAIFVPAGAMSKGRWRNQTLGAGASTWAAEAEQRAGKMTEVIQLQIAQASVRSAGTCNTMGTASTMTLIIEALGLSLPGAATIPSMDAAHMRMASACGRQAVELVWQDLKPRDIVTASALRNAIAVVMAISGSTNSLIHLIAMARRLGHTLTMDAFAEAGAGVPVLCNLLPAGKYLMEDFHFAGGLPGLMTRISHLLDTECVTVAGKSLKAQLDDAAVYDDDVIRPLANPIYEAEPLVVLKGSLAPRGAVLKRSAATASLLQHTGPAVVFESLKDLNDRIDSPDLLVTSESVLVLRNAGPVGGPGMPEWGMLPIPKKLLAQGVRDMVRISDARMSGTSYGTCVLHVCPESHVGGPLALVQDGDLIRLDTQGGRIDLLVDAQELARREATRIPPTPHYVRGYGALYSDHVMQADEGCDFDFLAREGDTREPEIH